MSPERDQEQLRGNILGPNIFGLFYGISPNLADPLENPGDVPQIEQIVELGGGREKSLLDLLPYRNGRWDDPAENLVELVREVALGKNGLDDWLEDDPYFSGESHIEDEEVVLQSVRNVVSPSAGVVHRGKEAQILDELEVSPFIFLQSVESLVLDQLSDDLEGNLVAPGVFLRHREIVDENGHFLSVLWAKSFSNFGLTNRLD